jgi:hypothetical protein
MPLFLLVSLAGRDGQGIIPSGIVEAAQFEAVALGRLGRGVVGADFADEP